MLKNRKLNSLTLVSLPERLIFAFFVLISACLLSFSVNAKPTQFKVKVYAHDLQKDSRDLNKQAVVDSDLHKTTQDIILIPGLMSDGSVWSELIDDLVKLGNVHVISLAGFASTPKIQDQSLNKVKQELIDYIKDNQLVKPNIVGHSLGGFMAFWLASTNPEHIGAIISVDGLPFIGPVFTQTNQSTVESLQPQASQIKHYYAQMSSQQLANQTRYGINIQATSDASKEKVIAMASQSDPKTVGSAIYTLMSTDLRNTISAIKSPALLIGAAGGFSNMADKTNAKALYQQQLSKLNGAKLVMNNQSRHFIMLDQPLWLSDQITQFFKPVVTKQVNH